MAKVDVKTIGHETRISGENAREMAEKSHEARKRNTAKKKILKEEILKKMKKKDWDEIINGLIERAKENGSDFEIWRDTIGEKPVDKQEVDVKEIPKINVVRKDG